MLCLHATSPFAWTAKSLSKFNIAPMVMHMQRMSSELIIDVWSKCRCQVEHYINCYHGTHSLRQTQTTHRRYVWTNLTWIEGQTGKYCDLTTKQYIKNKPYYITAELTACKHIFRPFPPWRMQTCWDVVLFKYITEPFWFFHLTLPRSFCLRLVQNISWVFSQRHTPNLFFCLSRVFTNENIILPVHAWKSLLSA